MEQSNQTIRSAEVTMNIDPGFPGWKDKALFTPGPLTTSRPVKQAMLRDLGSRDTEFIALVRDIRRRLAGLSGDPDRYTAVLMQGSGTFGIEALVSSVIPANGRLLVLVNGAYGERILKIAAVHRIPAVFHRGPEHLPVDLDRLEDELRTDPGITHVAIVHCETTTGIMNPVEEAGAIVDRFQRCCLVDAMSSFGAYPLHLSQAHIHFLVSSSNKCIEGVPGFSFTLADRETLQAARGSARSLSLDLVAQWDGLEGDGQFRFTPPTHALLAFHQALLELEAEGGVEARAARYRRNYEMTVGGMQDLGFVPYLPEELHGHTITSFLYPDHPNFSFREFYERLSRKGCVIYPGKLSQADCFRIGHIGRLDSSDVLSLLAAVRETLTEMQIDLT